MPAWRNLIRRGEASSSPVGEESCANGPTTLTIVSVQADFSGVGVSACTRCWARVGAHHRYTPVSPRVTARKTSAERTSIDMLLDANAHDAPQDENADRHQDQHVLDDRDA